MLRLSRVYLFVTSLLFCAAVAHGSVSPQRIVTVIDPSQVSELPGNVPAAARNAVDLGAAPADLQLTDLTLRFTMSDAQQAALSQLLIDQQNPASSHYHQWLTPEQFAAQFGLAPADMQTVSNWLTSQGFTVTHVARGGTAIEFSGSVAQAQNAFHTQLHRVTLDGEAHITNLTEPALPAAIAAVTGVITGLHDFHLKPRLRVSIVPSADAGAGSTVQSHYTSAATGNHFIAPGDFYTIYDEKALTTAGTTGAGVTVAVMGQTDIGLTDVANFRANAGLSATAPTVMLYGTDPLTSTTDLGEALLDVEWSGATAPGATILYVNSKNVIDTSLYNAIQNNVAPILSLSYGTCEANVGLAGLVYYNALMQQANAQGQTVVSAAGDSGATDCDYAATTATKGLAVDFPGDIPAVTSIGGTMFSEGTGTYWGANNGTAATALSYIPEVAWNEDSSSGIGSGGGGTSIYFTKPYWQVGTGVPADSARDVPDVSFSAASGHDGYLLCYPAYCTDGWKNSSGSHYVVGGTSVGAPSFSGLLALVVQKTGGRLGNANPKIYALANSTYYATVFHDVTSGNNSSPCAAGVTGCPAGGPIGYTAGVGYDRATGWGSLDVFNFVNSWPLVTPLVSTIGAAVSTTTLTGTPTSNVVQGTNIVLSVTVASGSTTVTATPTGTIQFLVDNVAFGAPVTLVAGKATLTVDTRTVAYGARTFTAAYSGDVTFAGSTGFLAASIISSGTPDFTLTPATTTATASSGGTAAAVLLAVGGLNSFTGTVSLSISSNANFGASLSSTSTTLSNTKTAGTTTLTLSPFKSAAISAPSALSQPPVSPWYKAGSGLALAGFLVLVLPRRRRFVGSLAAVISLGVLAASGCSGGGSTANNTPSTGTPAGTYTVTVTATGTSGTTTATHTATVTFTVN